MNMHELSSRVHDLETENQIMWSVLRSLMARGALIISEFQVIQPLLDARGIPLGSPNPAKDIVKVYGNAVKAPKDPGSDARDSSRTQAVRNVEKLLEAGYSVESLTQACCRCSRSCDIRNVEWRHRLNAGNFFGKRAGFREWLPDGDAVVPDEKKAKKVDGLFGKDGG